MGARSSAMPMDHGGDAAVGTWQKAKVESYISGLCSDPKFHPQISLCKKKISIT
jgi:hypothetical protein